MRKRIRRPQYISKSINDRTETHLSELAFASLDLVPSVAQGIRDAGFVRATPVQAMTLPIALTGKDVAGQAQTGTGKTAAFLVALYQRLLTNPPRRGAARRASAR